MATDNLQGKAYLLELYNLIKDDSRSQVSMYTVGANIGLEKAEAGRLAEDLMAQGWVEVKTLSGGIGITADGIQAAQAAGGSSVAAAADRSLGSDLVLTEAGRLSIDSILGDIKQGIHQAKAPYRQLEEMVIDIKTIDVQLLSPRPKTAILREVLRSLGDCLETTGHKDLSGRLKTIVGD
jgi:hypothetical protein